MTSKYTALISCSLLLLVACSSPKTAEQTANVPTQPDASTATYEQVSAESAAIMNQLKQAATEINSQCPLQVDAGTRLDSAQATSTTELQYFYTLTALNRADIDVAKLEATTRPVLIESVKTNAAMTDLRDHSITMRYTYRDRNGDLVMRIAVGPEEYGK